MTVAGFCHFVLLCLATTSEMIITIDKGDLQTVRLQNSGAGMCGEREREKRKAGCSFYFQGTQPWFVTQHVQVPGRGKQGEQKSRL